MNTKYIIIAVVIALGFTSCKGFLDEYSQDEVAPKDVREYAQILQGEAYIRDYSLPYTYIDLLTDDVKAVVNLKNRNGNDQRTNGWGYFSWQNTPEITTIGSLNPDIAWSTLYHHILTANIILKDLPKMKGSESEKLQLEGEAHAIRLNAYFYLANLYAPPYDKAKAESTPGVPLNDKAHAEDAQFPRAKLSENYAEMIQDLEAAENAFQKSGLPGDIFTWNLAAVSILGSRMYLYKQDYENTIKYANKALKINPAIQDLNALDLSKDIFLTKKNKEITLSYGSYSINYFVPGSKAYFSISDELESLYTKNDLRKSGKDGLFFRSKRIRIGGSWLRPVWAYYPAVEKGGPTGDTMVFGFAIRTAEALLNRAEAYAELGKLSEAMADINRLRENRMKKGTPALEQPATKEEVIKIVREERRRELAFEQHRWFDLRRWGQPEIKHFYIKNMQSGEGEEYTLSQGDPRYTLPIPQAVLESDPSLSNKK